MDLLEVREAFKKINYLDGGFQGLKGKLSRRGLNEEMLRGRERFSGSK